MYTFSAGVVQHIHQISYDEYRDCYWILTGDQDRECAIWQASIDFSTVTPVFSGQQKYRSCYIMPSRKGIAYATDTPIEKNWIYYSEQATDGTWAEPKRIFEMPGPCIYGKKLNDGRYIMATSVEPDAILTNFRYYLSSKLGGGVRERSTSLICGSPDGQFDELLKFEKDFLKMWLFQFGNILFPNVEATERVLCTGQSLKKIDGKTIQVLTMQR